MSPGWQRRWDALIQEAQQYYGTSASADTGPTEQGPRPSAN
jgi:hypothetical protein